MLDQPLLVNGSNLRISCVNVGNPHCVVLGQTVNASLAKSLGPLICEHPMFPNRTNVQFVEVLDRQSVRIEIWERGAGYTLASGSSSCAVAAVCHELGLVDRFVTVSMPGGSVDIEIKTGNRLLLTGPVRSVASGQFAADLKKRLRLVD
jgi:diaminopimelate epimerase